MAMDKGNPHWLYPTACSHCGAVEGKTCMNADGTRYTMHRHEQRLDSEEQLIGYYRMEETKDMRRDDLLMVWLQEGQIGNQRHFVSDLEKGIDIVEEQKLRILDLSREYHAKRRDIIGIALECGALLTEAKDRTPHGEWSAYLAGVELNDRTARHWMQLANWGVNADTVGRLGGIRATLEQFRPRKGASNKELALQAILLEKTIEAQEQSDKIAEVEAEVADLHAANLARHADDPVALADFKARDAQFKRNQAEMREMRSDNAKMRGKITELQAAHKQTLKKIKEAEVA